MSTTKSPKQGNPLDRIRNVAELCDYMRNRPVKDYLTNVRELINMVSKNINVNYEPDDDTGKPKRVVMAALRNRSKFSKLLDYQCNGLVLTYPDWQIVATSSPTLNKTPSISALRSKLSDYTIYPVKDGSVVTLYWYDGKWTLSSANSYDVSDYSRFDNITFMEALTKLLKKYPKFSFDKLDRGYCYILGFRHHAFHPLITDPEDVWLLHAQDLNRTSLFRHASTKLNFIDIGIPHMEKLEDPITLDQMLENNKNALQVYLDTLKEGKPTHNYGYILRGSYEKNGRSAIVLLESKLFSAVRNMMYSIPRGRNAIKPTTPREFVGYVLLRNVLSKSDLRLFVSLFPQYTEQLEVVRRTLEAVYTESLKQLVTERDRRQNSDSPVVDTLVRMIVNDIETTNLVNVFEPNGPYLLQDVVYSISYLNRYFEVLTRA